VLADPDLNLKPFSMPPMLQCLILYGGKDRQFAHSKDQTYFFLADGNRIGREASEVGHF
jgi:hypothetical protein